MTEHPERSERQQRQKRANQTTAVLVGVGTGLIVAVLFGLLLGRWPFSIGLGVIVALALAFGLNAIRRDSRKLADHAPESDR